MKQRMRRVRDRSQNFLMMHKSSNKEHSAACQGRLRLSFEAQGYRKKKLAANNFTIVCTRSAHMLWKRIIGADSVVEYMAGDSAFGTPCRTILKVHESKRIHHAKHHTLGQFSWMKPGRNACESMSVRRYLPFQAAVSTRSRRLPLKCMCSTNIASSCVYEMCMCIVAIAPSVHYNCDIVCKL